MAEKAVLDASAVLAVLRGEAGADKVRPVYEGASISAVNFAEVASDCVERGMPGAEVRRLLEAQPLKVVPFEGDQIFEAARLRRLTHHEGLSLGDRACLGLARLCGLPAVTADRAWRKLKLGIVIRIIR